MEEMRVCEPVLWLELIQCYLGDAMSNLADLCEQASQHDVDAVRKTLHTLKGSSIQIGGLNLGDLIEEAEDMITHGAIEVGCQMIPQIHTAFDSLRSEMENAIVAQANSSPAR
jgi:chemotaxis protein histidine kinase CheA